MRATVMYRAGDVRIENIPDATIVNPTDAVIRITRACICGSDLWPYNELEPTATGRRMGHEAIGVVEAVGGDVHTVKRGDVVVMPFAFSDGTCMFCGERSSFRCL
jgi:threonine dehydrogenase-like Zn-dependent dehydrogenase